MSGDDPSMPAPGESRVLVVRGDLVGFARGGPETASNQSCYSRACRRLVKYPTKYAVFLLYAAIETTAHPQRAE
jgi:hypothetical protein